MMSRRVVSIVIVSIASLYFAGAAPSVMANDWSEGKYKISCTKNTKAKLRWFRKHGWSLFHTVHKKDSTLRVFRKGLTFRMARQYKKSGKLCVYKK